MYTAGFVPTNSDVITIGVPFVATLAGIAHSQMLASYITVGTGGAGDIVWKNYYGDLNWLPGAIAGQTYILGAIEIVASGVVNGISRATTASNLIFIGSQPVAGG